VELSTFRIKGFGTADATQVIARAGFYSMSFFLSLCMQNVLGYTPVQAGAAYIPVTVAVGSAAAVIAAQAASLAASTPPAANQRKRHESPPLPSSVGPGNSPGLGKSGGAGRNWLVAPCSWYGPGGVATGAAGA
jgi:hypothetical protein